MASLGIRTFTCRLSKFHNWNDANRMYPWVSFLKQKQYDVVVLQEVTAAEHQQLETDLRDQYIFSPLSSKSNLTTPSKKLSVMSAEELLKIRHFPVIAVKKGVIQGIANDKFQKVELASSNGTRDYVGIDLILEPSRHQFVKQPTPLYFGASCLEKYCGPSSIQSRHDAMRTISKLCSNKENVHLSISEIANKSTLPTTHLPNFFDPFQANRWSTSLTNNMYNRDDRVFLSLNSRLRITEANTLQELASCFAVKSKLYEQASASFERKDVTSGLSKITRCEQLPDLLGARSGLETFITTKVEQKGNTSTQLPSMTSKLVSPNGPASLPISPQSLLPDAMTRAVLMLKSTNKC
jgi:hypothetical protein